MKSILVLLIALVYGISGEKKQEWICDASVRIQGFALNECHDWYSNQYKKWKSGELNWEYVAIIVATATEMKDFYVQMAVLRKQWRDKISAMKQSSEESSRMERYASHTTSYTTGLIQRIDEERIFKNV